MLQVEIQNSWQLDLVRIYRNRIVVKDYYFNLVLAEVFKSRITKPSEQDLTVIFSDNHFCNVDNLDYKKLHMILRRSFRTVSFASECSYDHALDPEYFSFITRWPFDAPSFISASLENLNHHDDSSPESGTKKMFGLHILRPDVHRLGLLVCLHRRGLLDHVDVRLGFSSQEFGNLEYSRSSNIDAVCQSFDICHRDLFDLIDSMPLGDRINFRDNATYPGLEMIKQDVKKNQFHKNFAIELVCSSSIHDHVLDWGEKILRPMLCKQPFIWVCSAHGLAVIKKVGLKVFDDLWDVSWDHYNEGWLPSKIDAIVDTCAFIVDKYSISDIKHISKEHVNYNFFMIVDQWYHNREKFGGPDGIPDRIEQWPSWLLSAPDQIKPL